MCDMADELHDIVEGEAEELSDSDSPLHELPAIAEVRPLERPTAPVVPAAQAAALAATGFVAGAAAAALVRRRSARKLGRRRGGSRAGVQRSADGVPVVSTYTYLVRVQVLGRSAE